MKGIGWNQRKEKRTAKNRRETERNRREQKVSKTGKGMDDCYDCVSWTIIFLHLSPLSPSCCGYLSALLVMPCRLHTSSSPYLLCTLPSPLLHCLHTHLYLLIHNLCAPFVPASPHCRLMYHCTTGAHFQPLLHVYYHAPYACLSSISTG